MQDYYNNWNKQWKDMSESLIKITSQLSSLVLKDNLRDMKNMFAKSENLNLFGNMAAFDKHLKTYKMLHQVDLSPLLGISERIKMISPVDISGMTTALQQLADNEFLQELKNYSIVSRGYDLQRLARIMQNSLEQVNWSQDVSVDIITEEIAEEYIEQEADDDVEKKKTINKIELINLICVIIGGLGGIGSIIGAIFAVMSYFNSKPLVVYNTYNNVTEVTSACVLDLGIDAEFMNEMGYRIINRNNVMPRIKPDCSSMVTGHLYIGQVVNVSDRYKKWIEITWRDDEGNYCSGWIQNYKVSKFR